MNKKERNLKLACLSAFILIVLFGSIIIYRISSDISASRNISKIQTEEDPQEKKDNLLKSILPYC